MVKADVVLYLCNGKMKGCAKTGCYKNGGECRHTTDVKYARNFEKMRGFFKEAIKKVNVR